MADPVEKKDPRRVVVFGGGVTGLTVAHELIERGFEVYVLEPTPSLNHYGDCDVGGMARTQYAHLSKTEGRNAKVTALTQVPRIHGTPHLVYFEDSDTHVWTGSYTLLPEKHIANSWPEPTNLEKLQQLVKVLQEIRKDHNAAAVGKTVLRIIGHTCDSNTPERSRLVGELRAQAVEENLKSVPGWPTNQISVIVESRGAAEPIGNNNHPAGRARNNRVSFELEEIRLPAEHGYRFYPAFYWHLDDQLGRIPVYDDTGKPTYRCVLDNLEHAENARFAIEDGQKPLIFDRRLPRSFEELRRTAEELARRLEFPPEDVVLFELKMLKFMTSSTRRRKEQYETMSWWDFVEGDRYSENTQRHLLAAPQALVAMEAYVTDAYTAGNIYTQLLLDHLSAGTRVDRTMNAPTSEAWLRHWKRYLRRQGVKFFVGQLDGFKLGDKIDGKIDEKIDDTRRRLVPVASGMLAGERCDEPLPEPVYADEEEALAGDDKGLRWRTDADYYVLALPAEAATKLLEPIDAPILDTTLQQLKAYDVGGREADGKRTGPLRDFVGIQFYFDHDIKFTSGHTYYPDSDWGLSSISQLQFWKDRRTRDSRYLGVLSVDIGNMVAPDRSAYRQRVLAARTSLFNADKAAQRSAVPLTKEQRQALDGAKAVREEATALIQRLPLPLSPQFRAAMTNTRSSAREFTGRTGDPGAAALRRALADAHKQARTDNDRRVSRILSGVDKPLGALANPTAFTAKDDTAGPVSRALMSVVDAMQFTDEGKTAWQSTPQEIAQTVWRQIKLGLDTFRAEALPDPRWFHLDDNLQFELDDAGKPVKVSKNTSPFQINPAGEFERRPGAEMRMPPEVNEESERETGAFDRDRFAFYEIANKQWVVAGMFTKTYTRLATMELAVESGRHAVNAILHDITTSANRGIGKIAGDFCEVQSPERREIADLAFLKRIDEQLLAEGLPHFIDIVGLEDAVLTIKRMRQRGLYKDSPLDQALKLLRVATRTGRKEMSSLEDFVPMPNLLPSRETVLDAVDKVAGFLHTVLGRGTNDGGNS